MRRVPLAFLLLTAVAFGGAKVGPQLSPTIARAIDIEAVIWQFEEDYPGADGDDTKLPVRTVYIKTHDGTDWMSVYDEHPKAVYGPLSVRRLIDDYRSQGIEVVAWFVPKGGDIDKQLRMAHRVLDTGVKALYADIEPFDGFCYTDCAYLAQEFWWRLRAERPEANLGVIYDPRPWTWGDSATALWLATADAALPMCYWEDFVDQPPFNDPAGCVNEARTDLAFLAPERSLEYIPMLQGNSSAERFVAAAEAARTAGSSKVSVWRRGVVGAEVWNAARNLNTPPAVQPAPDYGAFWAWSPCPWDGCLLQELSSDGVYVMYGGAKFAIPNEEVLWALGYGYVRWFVADGALASVPDVPVDGSLVRELWTEGVYVVRGGARFAVPSLDALYAMGLGEQPVYNIPPGGLNQIPTLPRDGTQITEVSGGPTWQIAAGARFALPSPEARDALVAGGHLTEGVHVVPDGGAAQVPLLPRNGARLREYSSAGEWQIAAGTRIAIPDGASRDALIGINRLERALTVVADGALAQVPNRLPDGAWVQELGTSREWQIAEGLKFALPDPARRDALITAGALSTGLIVVAPAALAGIPDGPREGSLLKEPSSAAVYVRRCGSLYRIADQAQLDRLVAAGVANLPVMTVSGPLVEPELEERGRCADGRDPRSVRPATGGE